MHRRFGFRTPGIRRNNASGTFRIYIWRPTFNSQLTCRLCVGEFGRNAFEQENTVEKPYECEIDQNRLSKFKLRMLPNELAQRASIGERCCAHKFGCINVFFYALLGSAVVFLCLPFCKDKKNRPSLNKIKMRKF